MTSISDAQVDELLRAAEQRLQGGLESSATAPTAVAATRPAALKSQADKSVSQPPTATITKKETLSVREPQTKAMLKGQASKVSEYTNPPANLICPPDRIVMKTQPHAAQ